MLRSAGLCPACGLVGVPGAYVVLGFFSFRSEPACGGGWGRAVGEGKDITWASSFLSQDVTLFWPW